MTPCPDCHDGYNQKDRRMLIGRESALLRLREKGHGPLVDQMEADITRVNGVVIFHQPGDGPYQQMVKDHLENGGEVVPAWIPDGVSLDEYLVSPKLTPFTLAVTGVAHDPQTNLPLAYRPQTSWEKVKSLWTAVSGGRAPVEQATARYRVCTSVGGATFAPVDGTVTRIEGRTIHLGQIPVTVAHDERTAVQVGQAVKQGQLVALPVGTDKPCQYLKREGQKMYCDACGCGTNRRAELSNKLKYTQLTCPRAFPLFTPTETRIPHGADE